MNTDDPNRIIALIAATKTLANAWQTMLAFQHRRPRPRSRPNCQR